MLVACNATCRPKKTDWASNCVGITDHSILLNPLKHFKYLNMSPLIHLSSRVVSPRRDFEDLQTYFRIHTHESLTLTCLIVYLLKDDAIYKRVCNLVSRPDYDLKIKLGYFFHKFLKSTKINVSGTFWASFLLKNITKILE